MADVVGIKISQLESTTDLQDLYTIGTDKNNSSKKVKLQFLKEAADYANSQGDYAKESADNIVGNIGVNDYPLFTSKANYVAGDVVNYQGRLYRFTGSHQAAEWSGNDVVLTSVNKELSNRLKAVESPSGDPLHYMYIACGATWNAVTGFWELNGLNDITNEQMRTIYICTKDYNLEGAPTIFEYAYTLMRTNLFPMEQHSLFKMLPESRAFNAGSMFYVCSNLEVLRLCTPRDDISFGFPVLDASALFYGCKKLKTIIGNIVMKNATVLQDMFGQCNELENVEVTLLNKSIDFSNSPKLSNGSILNMINNSSATSAISITLHPDAYARAESDSAIQSALNEHPLVSLIISEV